MGKRRSRRKKEREKRTPEVLRAASDHLHYEIGMLMEMANLLASDKTYEQAIKNSFIESFTIHARALLKFLYGLSPQPDDVIADDFFPTSLEWKKVRPKMTKLLRKVPKRVGREVAHLTYARQDVTPETKPWEYRQIAHDMEVRFKEFLLIVPEELLGERWESEKEWIREMRKTT